MRTARRGQEEIGTRRVSGRNASEPPTRPKQPSPGYTGHVPPDRFSDAELEQLQAEWPARFEEGLAQASFSVQELTDLAERQRAAAQITDSPGQRRGLLRVAERYERAAAERAAAPRQ